MKQFYYFREHFRSKQNYWDRLIDIFFLVKKIHLLLFYLITFEGQRFYSHLCLDKLFLFYLSPITNSALYRNQTQKLPSSNIQIKNSSCMAIIISKQQGTKYQMPDLRKRLIIVVLFSEQLISHLC